MKIYLIDLKATEKKRISKQNSYHLKNLVNIL